MRTHGWSSDLPTSNEDARMRIIAATVRCISRLGLGKTGLADVAAEVGVTRATIYRYFPSTEALIRETAIVSSANFLQRLQAHLSGMDDPADLLIEALAYSAEQLPFEPTVSLMISGRDTGIFSQYVAKSGVGSGIAQDFIKDLLKRWPELSEGPEPDGHLGDLTDFLLRQLQSLVLYPWDGTGGVEKLRDYLDRFVRPAIVANLSNFSQAL